MRKTLWFLCFYLALMGLVGTYCVWQLVQADDKICDAIERSVRINGESLIETAGGEERSPEEEAATAAAIERYRSIIDRRLMEERKNC